MPSTHRLPARPPLPLGPMRPPRDLSALTSDHSERDPGPAAIATDGGALSFELRAASRGVHVVRLHAHDDGARVSFSVLFEDEREFLEWLDADPARYVHPLVFQQARRCFGELMSRRVAHDTVRI